MISHLAHVVSLEQQLECESSPDDSIVCNHHPVSPEMKMNKSLVQFSQVTIYILDHFF